MKKISKTAMLMMGGMAIAASSYYMALPKSKRNAIKEDVSKIIKNEKKMISDL